MYLVYIKKFNKMFIQNKYIRDLRTPLPNFEFATIHIIHKTLVLIKNHMNYLQDNIFE